MTAARHPAGVVGWLCLLAWLLLNVHSLVGYQPQMLANPDVCSASRSSQGGVSGPDSGQPSRAVCDVCCVFAQHHGAALPSVHAALVPQLLASVHRDALPPRTERRGEPWPPGQPRAPPALS